MFSTQTTQCTYYVLGMLGYETVRCSMVSKEPSAKLNHFLGAPGTCEALSKCVWNSEECLRCCWERKGRNAAREEGGGCTILYLKHHGHTAPGRKKRFSPTGIKNFYPTNPQRSWYHGVGMGGLALSCSFQLR